MVKTAINPTRQENYPEWYQQVIKAADMAENSPVRGCMVIKPWGYAIWENIQKELDQRLKATGHSNAYFPLLIPLSQLEKEAQHIEGFAKECAVVTHHRLINDGHGKLKPDGLLEEPLIIRPTSETMIGSVFSKWVHSYRDLPLLINQWANVMRWEMRTRLFLRSSEFLWQEGHTAHATEEEAREETLKILDLYENFVKDVLAIPVIKGEKTESERFPGAVSTYCIEAMMQDGKALQAGTSHFLGQNFSKAYDIQFLNRKGETCHAWTTSWGVSTRLIGGLIMSHSDDNGLVLPPKVAPYHVIIIPMCKSEDEQQDISVFCHNLATAINKKYIFGEAIRVHIDSRDIRGGEKKWQWVKKGVPIILEIGKNEIAEGRVSILKRNCLSEKKVETEITALLDNLSTILEDIQNDMFQTAQARLDNNLISVDDIKDFTDLLKPDSDSTDNKFIYCFSSDNNQVEDIIKPFKITARCVPFGQENSEGKCIFTGEKVSRKIIFAKAY